MSDELTAQSESEALFLACAGEDQARRELAWQLLGAYIYPSIWHLAQRYGFDEGIAQDWTQDGLIHIYTNLHKLRRPTAFKTFAVTLAKNKARDNALRLLRHDYDSERVESLLQRQSARRPQQPEPEMAAEHALTNEQLRRSLQASDPLSERSKRVIIGKFIDGEDDTQLAARESEKGPNEVKPSHVRVTRAKNIKKLRDSGWWFDSD